MEKELTIRIVVQKPPKGVDYCLQKGRGSTYQTIRKQRSNGDDVRFEFQVGLKAGKRETEPDFAGPFVQGPPGERFIYLDIGTAAGQLNSPWTRRLKVPLSGITSEMVGKDAIVEALIPGTAKDGGPSCATVRPTGGWKGLSK